MSAPAIALAWFAVFAGAAAGWLLVAWLGGWPGAVATLAGFGAAVWTEQRGQAR